MRLIGEPRRPGAKSKSRIQALTLPELAEMVRDLVHRVAKAGGEFDIRTREKGRQPRDSHVVNAVILHFLSMSEEEQDRAYLAGKGKLERLLELEERPTREAVRSVIFGEAQDTEGTESTESTDKSKPGGGTLSRGRHGSIGVG